MKKVVFTFFAASVIAFACGTNPAEENKPKKGAYEIEETLPSTGGPVTAAEKEDRMALLISESKKTLDSIEVTYQHIRAESRRHTLTLEERERVNEALVDLNDARDLVVLEMEANVIRDLEQKTASLKSVMVEMNQQSQKLHHIAQLLSRVSGLIEKTTNLLAGALSAGLVRPPLAPATTN